MRRQRDLGLTIRVWAPACATGEEAYSIAMLFAEQAEAVHKVLDIKIFATDPGAQNLETARRGLFPVTVERDVSAERLERFFKQVNDTFQIKQAIRDNVIFAPQNLLHDPPFFRVDGKLPQFSDLPGRGSAAKSSAPVSLRAQRRRVSVPRQCRDGRPPRGPVQGRLQEVADLSALGTDPSRPGRLSRAGRRQEKPAPEPRQESGEKQSTGRTEVAQRALAEHYAPASVLIDRGHRVLWYHGDTERYLAHPPGEPTRDLFALAREGLRARLRAAVQEAVREGRQVAFSAKMVAGNTAGTVRGTVRPLRGARAEGLFLVSFEHVGEGTREVEVEGLAPAGLGDGDGRFEQRDESELTGVRRELRETIEELEASTRSSSPRTRKSPR